MFGSTSHRRRFAPRLAAGAALLLAFVAGLAPSADAAAGDWIRQFGTTADDYGEAIAATPDAAYVFGDTENALPGQVHAGQTDVFLRKYNADGSVAWTRQFGSAASDYSRGVVVRNNAVYVMGMTYGALPGEVNAGNLDAFVRRYDSDGNVQWTVQYGTAEWDTAQGVAVNSEGLWVTGATEGAFPGETNAGDNDVYLRHIGPGGAVLSTDQFGTSTYEGGNGVAATRRRVYVVGTAGSALPGQTFAGGESDGFLRIYRVNGSVVGTRQFGTAGEDPAFDVVTGLGGVYVAGDTTGSFTPQAPDGWDGFLRKFDGDGGHVWTRQFGSAEDDGTDGVAIAGGEIHVGGSTSGAFPGKVLRGGGDAFVQSYTKAGVKAGTEQWGRGGDDEAYGLAGSSSGLYVSGGTDGTFAGQTSEGMYDAFVRRFTDL